MSSKKALVVGSVAYDVVFDVFNTLKDEIIVKDGNVGSVSMMLTASNKKVFYGGTGGNIAYGLAIQGESPYLFSVVGSDFSNDYQIHLEEKGVDLKLIEKEGEYTATFYGISDKVKDQVGIFQPNTHGDYMHKIKLSDKFSKREIDSVGVAIFSPGTGESIRNHMTELRELAGLDVKVIFDPSQVLSIFFDEPLLRECIELSNIFIGNETEIKQLQDMMDMELDSIISLGLDYIIETKGSEGSIIHYKNGVTHTVDPVKAEKFVEQTGAGDAFRAGFIKGLLNGLTPEDSCKIGSQMGALNVAIEGGQNYSI